MEEAIRIQQLPPYLFARIEQKIAEAKARGIDVISLGIGDPDQPTPAHIIVELDKQSRVPANHQYPSSTGMLSYRQAVARWYQRRYHVELDPATEIVSLIGSKEGIAHISFCYVNPGDVNLIPDPGYPVYGIGTLLAGGQPHLMPLLEANGFLPDLQAIPAEVARQAKLMFINYPNNPTGAMATLEFFRQVVDFAREYDVIVCHDAAYTELTFDGARAPSFLEVDGAKDVGIEFNSVSKPYNMTGWRLGWAAGNTRVVESLARLKSNVDSGVFQAIQYAGIAALDGPDAPVEAMRELYRRRRDVVIEGLNRMGWKLIPSQATFYIWAPVPSGYNSSSFAEHVLEQAGVIVTPGLGYGRYGEGYFRISLTVGDDRLREALDRMRQSLGQVIFS